MNTEFELKRMICEIGSRMYQRNMIAANDGNISVKISEDEFLCTPTMVSKGFMTPEFICKVNGKGEILEANGSYRPSSEMKMHLHVYETRSDIRAVVHAHPVYATSFAIAGKPLDVPIIPEAVMFLGSVPLADYGTPSTKELADSLDPYLNDYDAILLKNHGAITYGADVVAAFMKMESVEFYAQLLYQSTMLGGPQVFTQEQVDALQEIKRKISPPKK